MTPFIMAWLKETVAPLGPLGDVLEIGSLNVNGSAREALPARTWLGIDRSSGAGVDLVADARDWLRDHPTSYDAVVACECFEHDPHWWESATAARLALRPGGVFIVTTPGIGFPLHDYGGDYWRFTEQSHREVVQSGLALLDCRTVGPFGNSAVCSVGRRPGGAPLAAVWPAREASVVRRVFTGRSGKAGSQPGSVELRKVWGPKAWARLHEGALTAETPEERHKLVDEITRWLPCGPCKKHWRAVLEEIPPRVGSSEEFFEWTAEAHNLVNQRKDEPSAVMSAEEARLRWGTQ